MGFIGAFVDLTPLIYRVQRAFGGRPRLADVCDRQWEVAPATVATAPPALYLPHELDKVTACTDLTNFDRETKRLRGGRREHAATVAYRIPGATILEGSVYKGPLRYPLVLEKRAPWSAARASPEQRGDEVLACSLFGTLFFGHWVTDDLTLELAAAALGTPLAVSRAPYGHEPAYRRVLDLPRPPTATHARCRSLTVLEDASLNQFKRQRYQELRRRLQSRFPPAGRHGVLLRRGSSGRRRVLVNEPEVEAFCQSRGFAVIDPQAMPVEQLMQQMMGAAIVIGVEGSQLAHGLLAMSDDGVLLVLEPPHLFNNTFKDHTDCLELGYAFVVGSRAAQDGFRIDLDELARTLDLVETRGAPGPITGSASAGARRSAERSPSPSVSGAA